ncbi:MAG: branched-chain amino acid ABC transporter permease [Gammaproteobacteria bacterium]|nr:branched-chain amino acid ABC transporter permease [Gammaproteobacteria bacterium]
MDQVAVNLAEVFYVIAVLVLISIGLAVVFGMMRVINLAHGEFLTLGGYAAIVSHGWGANIYVSMMVVAPLTVAVFGLIVERLIIRQLYGRLINTMLATWGLSLVMMGGFAMIFGNTTTGIASPIGGVTVGDYQISGYTLLVIAVALFVLGLVYMVLTGTRAGLIARGTMQNPEMSSAYGFNPSRIYMLTFAGGAALSGLAGGVLAPLVGLNPASGANYIAKAFITVISGGSSIVTGTIASTALYGTVSHVFTVLGSPVIGEIALLVAALILLKMLPTGISGRFFRDRV